MKIENIKFKAKRLGTGKWVVGDLAHRITDTCIAVKDMDDIVYYQVDPATVCQFTGEKDMNGNEICIGDIISNLETSNTFEVVWNDRIKRLDCKFLNAKSFNVPFGIFVSRYKRIVVLRSKFDKRGQCMNYKKVLTRYIQGRLSELSDVDAYEPNKLALSNLLYYLGKVASNELVVARLKIMVDSDIKRKKYLCRNDGIDSLHDDEYSKAASTIGKECLEYLQNIERDVKNED